MRLPCGVIVCQISIVLCLYLFGGEARLKRYGWKVCGLWAAQVLEKAVLPPAQAPDVTGENGST